MIPTLLAVVRAVLFVGITGGIIAIGVDWGGTWIARRIWARRNRRA